MFLFSLIGFLTFGIIALFIGSTFTKADRDIGHVDFDPIKHILFFLSFGTSVLCFFSLFLTPPEKAIAQDEMPLQGPVIEESIEALEAKLERLKEERTQKMVKEVEEEIEKEETRKKVPLVKKVVQKAKDETLLMLVKKRAIEFCFGKNQFNKNVKACLRSFSVYDYKEYK